MKVLYFSSCAWTWIKQRPHFIVEQFAKHGHSVLFVHRQTVGKKMEGKVIETPENLRIKEYRVLPFALKFPWIDYLNSAILRERIPWNNFDIIILTEPRQLLCLPAASHFATPIFYYCMDKYPDFFAGKKKEYLFNLEKKLCSRAVKIITSSQQLKKSLIELHNVDSSNIFVVRNAVSDDFLKSSGEATYIGTIDRWLDWDSLISFAEKNNSEIVRLIGPVRYRPERLPENIKFDGVIPHQRVRDVIWNSHLLLLPFKICPLVEAVDPVKLYEYLSCGKVVLSAYWPELDHFLPNDKLHFYHSPEEFCLQMKKLQVVTPNPSKEYNLKFYQENCWSNRFKLYQAICRKISK